MVSKSELHHYYPQFELDYFSENDLTWVYDRKINKFRQQSIKNTAAIKNYYGFNLKSGERTNELEKALSTAEGIAAPIIEKIHRGNYRLTLEERWEFAVYLGLKWTRNPVYETKAKAIYEMVIKMETRKLAMDEKRFKEAMEIIYKKTGKKVKDLEKQRNFILNPDRYHIDTNRLMSLQTMVKNLKATYEEIYKMLWVFRYAPKRKAFITSDNPFFVYPFFETDNPTGYGLRTEHTATFITLTPNVCLTLLNGRIGMAGGKIPSDMVDEANNYIALYSKRFVFSHSEKLLRKIIERTNLETIEPYKSIIEVQYEQNKKFKVVKS